MARFRRILVRFFLLVPGQAQANHHACPQVTITPDDDVDDQRRAQELRADVRAVPDRWPEVADHHGRPLYLPGSRPPCLRPNLGTPQGGDPPIPSPGSAGDPFPIEYVLRGLL